MRTTTVNSQQLLAQTAHRKGVSGILSSALLFTSTFMLIFGPKLFNIWDTLSLTALILIVAYLIVVKSNPQMKPSGAWWLPLVMFYVLITYSLIVVLFSATREYFYPIRYARVLVNYLGVLALCGLYRYRYGSRYRDQMLLHLFLVCAAHAVIMELQYGSDAFRSWVYSWNGTEDIYESGKRVTGLTISFNTLSLVQGIGLVIAPFVFHRWPRRIPIIVFYVCLVLLLPSLLLAGRTAAYVMLGLSTVTFAYTFIIKSRRSRVQQVAILTAIPIGAYALLRMLSPVKLELLAYTLSRFNEPLIALEQYGEFRVPSWNTVLNTMYFLPDSLGVMLFGSSISGRELIRIPSDVGYILTIFGVGILGLVFVMVFYVYALAIARRFWSIDTDWAIISILFVFAIAFLNAKENVMLTRHALTVTCLFLCAWYFEDSRRPKRYSPRLPSQAP